MEAISQATVDRERYRTAYTQVNCWRGHCMHHFSRAEASVCQALTRLVDGIPNSKITNTGLLGHRIEKLQTLLKDTDPQTGSGKTASEALEAFAALLPRRNALVHGHGAVALDARDDWVWTYSMYPQNVQQPAEKGHFTSNDATTFLKQLHSATQRLVATMRPYCGE